MTRRAGLPPAEGVRWESDGGGEFTIETVERPQRGTDDHAAPARRRGRPPVRLPPARDHPQVLRPHRRADRDEEGGVGRTRSRSSCRRGRDGQPGVGAVGAAEERDHRRAVQGVLQARRARLRGAAGMDARARRGPAGIHAAAVHSGARAVRPVGPRAPARHQAVRAARVHHGRRRAAAAGVPALRARRGRFERPAAQRLARDPAGVARHRGDPRRLHEAGARRCWRTSPRTRRRSTRRSGASSAGCSRKASARITPTATRSPSCCASRRRTPTPTTRTSSLADYVGAHEGRPGQDLLRHGRHVRAGEEQPASRDLPQEGHRGAAAVRPRRRMGRRAISPNSRASRCESVAKGGLDLGKLEDEAERKAGETEATRAQGADRRG